MGINAVTVKVDDKEYIHLRKTYRDKGEVRSTYLKSLGRKEKVSDETIKREIEKYEGAKMLIKELEDEIKIDEMKLNVIDLLEINGKKIREYNGQKVATARVKDQNNDEANLSLWTKERIDKVNGGDWILLKKGMARKRKYEEDGESKEVFDLTTGRYGKIEVLDE